MQFKNDRCLNECRKPIKHVCKDYAWNLRTCPYDYDKHCDIDEYLKNYTEGKIITNDLVITCDEIVDVPKTVFTNSNDKKLKHIKWVIIFYYFRFYLLFYFS